MTVSPHDEILNYARCVFSKGDIVELRAIITQGRVEREWVPAEDMADCDACLARWNSEGLNIYAGANPRCQRGQTGDASILLCRTLFVDFDKLPVGDGIGHDELACDRIEKAELPTPTLRLFSGHGIHAYWRLAEPLKPEDWAQCQRRMIATLGTDPVIKNPERIMRLPGFENLKEPKAPAFIIDSDPRRKYRLDELLSHLKAAEDIESQCPPNRTDMPPAKTMQPWLQVKARAMLYAAKWPPVAEHDGRNNAAYVHACQLSNDFSLLDADAWDILRAWNITNTPQLEDRELRAAFESAKKRAKGPTGTKLDAPKPKPIRAKPPEKAVVAKEKPSDVAAAIIEDTISGRRRAIDWPWPEVGRVTEALLNGTVLAICGPKGSTKTFFVLQCMTYWVECHEKVALLVLEEDTGHCLMRCLAQTSGVSSVTKTQWVREHPDEARNIKNEHSAVLDRVGVHIWDCPNDEMGLAEIARWVDARNKDGYRIVIVDPITAASQGPEPWREEKQFINHLKRMARQSGNSIILTTHPKKGGAHAIDMDSLAGSAAYIRFCQDIFWLEAHDEKEMTVAGPCGKYVTTVNRTLHILACRNGAGKGRRIAYRWHDNSLTVNELGLILKQEKKHEE